MHEPPAADSQPQAEGGRAPRPALLIAEGGADAGLQARLAEAGFEVACAEPGGAPWAVAELSPALVLLAFGAREGEGRLVSVARRLRAEPATFALPVVFLFREDARSLRSAAEHFGADDYFSQDAPAEALRARLEALAWREAAGRRAAPLAADQRSEIDNFIFLLDAVGADAVGGARGALALVEAGGGERALAEAHGFLKLNLRRLDAVAFYGPTTLLVYVARSDGAAARDLLAGLREEFLAGRAGADLSAGLASFPADGVEVEKLIEKAETALASARGANPAARVLVYGEADAGAPARPSREESAAAARDAGRRTAAKHSAAAPSLKSTKQGDAGAGEAAAEREAAARPGEVRARRPKLRRMMLIVSDAERMAQVNLLLRSTGSYEVRAAFDGQHALNLLRIDRPDLLLLEYELHGMDGAEMLRRLRKQSGHRRPPPAVVLVPGGREDLRREALEAGASAAVELPFDAVELLDALERVGDTE